MHVPGHNRALVVDDNVHARAICSMRLTRLGLMDIEEAPNGAEAILRLMSAPFAVVLMDWYMPDVTGAGVLQVLRDHRFGQARATPVILMTAYPSRENMARGRLLGVSAILPKPFSMDALANALEPILPVPLQASEVAYV